ncbi:hypothetical protein FH968_23390 [Buttiauxella sp. B2]|uniref:hypothetical protein n=1 Tax=Buttiauxella sp. B2 TaxID=2587812 RepID=UPI00112345E8|nr:hypothetical protein [Buttiauxella sp. B2]TNV09333.1 hypothetical protein FH968_23390 [Buttiauxella sp. B2]
MFDNLSTSINWIYKGVGLIAILYIIYLGGIGFLFRLTLQPFKITFHDAKTKELDNTLLSFQLLRLYHGINVDNLHDKKMVSQAVKLGTLSSKDFRFLCFAPPIGKSKHGRAEMVIFIIAMILMFSFPVSLVHLNKNYRYDYATFTEANNKVLISNIDIYDPTTKKYLSKYQCKKNQAQQKQILKSACAYLISSDPDMREELNHAIVQNNTGLRASLYLMILTIFIWAMTLFIYPQYRHTNNTFIDFKNNSE